MKSRPQVTFIEDPQIITECNRIQKIKGRASMVSSLIQSYGLKEHMRIESSRDATEDELKSFHSQDYLDKLAAMETEEDAVNENDQEEIGIGYDCPWIPNIMSFVRRIAGGSITAAEALAKNECEIAVNWFGGWHHCQRDTASGFCYVNDIVLAIHALRKTFDKILYVDLDVHHGDGVENAFAFTPKVYTFSMHQYEAGFFPGSGKLEDCGRGKGTNFTTNVPIKRGIDDEQYAYIFTNLFDEICYAFRPDAIVVQCGGDILAGDPLGGFNVTLYGAGICIQKIMSINKPTLYLGGGGYNLSNTSIYWTYLTALLTGNVLPSDIPDFYKKNENTTQDIEDLLETLFDVLENVST
ncbi:HDAC8 [Lepeophtheirus salmonis]|uniref:Histone deacetylase 8 n=1 Tax=Lepeophtheirus salmonis TaxID=72036 RepID=A0A7R8D3C4_LEPSM|nr:HDAC8 [Lepeophtheirus salmonis]CAF3015673.1 HDAC8 [Lepeophtheirus salmonis]